MSDSAEFYKYPKNHGNNCMGCIPLKEKKPGEIYRFTYKKEEPSNNEKLIWDHYVLLLPEKFNECSQNTKLEYNPCLIITKNPRNKRETELLLFRQPGSRGSTSEHTAGTTQIHLWPEEFNRDETVLNSSWPWMDGTCIGIDEVSMIHKQCLHVLKPDTPTFGIRLNDEQLRIVCCTLECYNIRPVRNPIEQGIIESQSNSTP